MLSTFQWTSGKRSMLKQIVRLCSLAERLSLLVKEVCMLLVKISVRIFYFVVINMEVRRFILWTSSRCFFQLQWVFFLSALCNSIGCACHATHGTNMHCTVKWKHFLTSPLLITLTSASNFWEYQSCCSHTWHFAEWLLPQHTYVVFMRRFGTCEKSWWERLVGGLCQHSCSIPAASTKQMLIFPHLQVIFSAKESKWLAPVTDAVLHAVALKNLMETVPWHKRHIKAV